MITTTIDTTNASSVDYPVLKVGTITGKVVLFTAPNTGVILDAGDKVDGYKGYAVGATSTTLKEHRYQDLRGDFHMANAA